MRPVATSGAALLAEAEVAHCFIKVWPLAKLYLETAQFETTGYLGDFDTFTLADSANPARIGEMVDERWQLPPEPLAAIRFAREFPDLGKEATGTPFVFPHTLWRSPKGWMTLGLHAGMIRDKRKKIFGWELVPHAYVHLGCTRGTRVVTRSRIL